MTNRQPVLKPQSPHSTIRIGAVTYLNSRPLIEGLATTSTPLVRLTLDYPSRLADDLAAEKLDVALIPSIEAFGHDQYEVVSDACVSTHGAVFSVKLYSRVHPGQIRTLALDEGSRTSAALARIMLSERFGVEPTLEILPIGSTTSDCSADAVLLIGDRAMKAPQEAFETVWDLGEEWVNWTGLPFVFAMWVTRKDAGISGLAQILNEARDEGLKNLSAITKAGADQLQLPEQMVHDYFTKNLHFRLGPAEKAGLRLFKELAYEHGLIPSNTLNFHDENQIPPEFES